MLSKMEVIMVKHYDVLSTMFSAYVAGGATMVGIMIFHSVVRFAVISFKQQKLASQ